VAAPTLPPAASAATPTVALCSSLQQPPTSLPVPVAPQPLGVCCLTPSNWVGGESSDEDVDEELAPRSPLAVTVGTTSLPLDGQLCDTVVVVEGLGSLSLLSADVSKGPICEVPLSGGASLPASSELWVASLSSDDDEDDGVLAPQGVVSPSILDTVEVRHDEKVLAEPSLFVAAAALGDEEGWVQVGWGGRHGHEPSSLYQKEGLERSLAFKHWARGRCFRCLERGHQVRACPTYASVVVVLAIGSISAMRAFLQHVLALRTLVLVLQMLVLLVGGAALCPLSLVAPCCLRVGLTSCTTHLCLMWCCQDPLLGAARSSMSMAVWTLSFSPR
jgi:hypothetical protein